MFMYQSTCLDDDQPADTSMHNSAVADDPALVIVEDDARLWRCQCILRSNVETSMTEGLRSGTFLQLQVSFEIQKHACTQCAGHVMKFL